MLQRNRAILKQLAEKYIWWKTPDETLAQPERLFAQVMNIGDYEDVLSLIGSVGENALREVLVNAEVGQFSERSWAYWHYRLGLALPEQIPPMPSRKVA
jgi:hypothetical protein